MSNDMAVRRPYHHCDEVMSELGYDEARVRKPMQKLRKGHKQRRLGRRWWRRTWCRSGKHGFATTS